MKIFGIGLSRTGKKSLTKALTILGFKILHYPIDQTLYDELIRGYYNLSILNNVDGITDITVAPYFPHLDKIFPGSKFIFTLRDKDSWLEEMKEHWEGKKDDKSKPDYELKMKIRYFLRSSLYGCYTYSEERLSYAYDVHHRNVREYFNDKPNNLLELNILNGDGWDKLCHFLGYQIPDIDFPHVEHKKEL